ncbi:MAG TPA: ABC transporter permease [Devosiaceae bacterium]|nr:ABC transporter permease [Devosiaceae bacterium]
MIQFLIKRVLQAIFVVVAVTLIVALAIRLTGDPAVMMLQGSSNVTQADLDRIHAALGLNQPFYVQYFEFMRGLVTWHLGKSFQGDAPVSDLIANALPLTLWLSVASLAVSIIISVPLGIHAAVKKGGWSDQLIRLLSLVGLSFPNFWLAIMMVLLFSVTLKWLPPSGATDPSNFIMPAVTIGIILTATNVRLVRSAMLETLQSQYIMVARAKGLSEPVVLYKHALRNCAIPLVTYLGLQFGGLLGGIVVVERIFAWPGIGSLALDAVYGCDYPVLQSVIAVLALLIVGANLLVDIVYGLIDPRIRVE